MNNTLTDVPGIKVGHATHEQGATGCTVVICPDGTVGGVDVRGGAPGTRETDLLNPQNLVQTVNAIVLSGGSAYGLATADGVMKYLAEHNLGFKDISGYVVPIVPAAILFDLPVGEQGIYPTAEMGYMACEAATDAPVEQGSVGAGTGTRIGPMMGNDLATKGGIGSASMDLGDGLVVAALVAVNAFGDIIDEKGEIIAGLRLPDDSGFMGILNVMKNMAAMTEQAQTRENTVIGVIATNAKFSKANANTVAQMAHDGIARAVNPAHTMYDGDTIFTVATGEIPANPSVIGAFAAEVMASAIRNAVKNAKTLAGVRALND